MSSLQSIPITDKNNINDILTEKIIDLLGEWLLCVNESDALTEDEKDYMVYYVKKNIERIINKDVDGNEFGVDIKSRKLKDIKFEILKQKFKNNQ